MACLVRNLDAATMHMQHARWLRVAVDIDLRLEERPPSKGL